LKTPTPLRILIDFLRAGRRKRHDELLSWKRVYFFKPMTKETEIRFQNRRMLMILLGVLVTLMIITVITVLVKN